MRGVAQAVCQIAAANTVEKATRASETRRHSTFDHDDATHRIRITTYANR